MMKPWQRANTFAELGHSLVLFDDEPYHKISLGRRVIRRVTRPFGFVFTKEVTNRFNRDFCEALFSANPDLAWIEKSTLLYPETLDLLKNKIPKCKFICFQDDDPFGLRRYERPFWTNFLNSIYLYDLCVVPKEINIGEFHDFGAKSVIKYLGGYYEKIFYPLEEWPNQKFIHEVCFVGTPIDKRVGSISKLIEKYKINVDVYGNDWNKTIIYYKSRKSFHGECTQQEYVDLIRKSKISLGFVSHSNRDEYNGRTFDITASMGFLLAERTSTHLGLFEEGKEAEFFSSSEECADKIAFYLKYEKARQEIAKRGYLRCLKSDYSMRRQLSDVLAHVSGP